ncbi:MAG: dihydrolipoamide dehydrogenase [Verrucomicrobia bacterium]|jgi:dihydrolipoamide dehydrogenase|nr:MAG: dihydrolipoamide dehydrogenase [Verrucomicrobiota bacterium]
MKYDLIVIGGGPAGYAAAIRAGQLGKKTACVEMDRAGGTCLNWGCIPTKSLIRNAEIYQLMQNHSGDFGLGLSGLTYDWSKVVARSRGVSDKLAGGIEFLFKKNKVDSIRGKGSLLGNGKVEVTDANGAVSVLEGENILIATGCTSRPMPGLPFDGQRVISSREAMVLAQQPREIIIIGAGAIGVEFAYFFNAFGTKVTIVEMMPNLLPVEDEEISKTLEKSFAKQGIRVLTETKTVGSQVTGSGVEITVQGKVNETLRADLCLVAIGVQPVLPEGREIKKTERGYLKVDDRYQTSIPKVFAAGDITGPPWLAHTATFEAVQAVEGIFNAAYKPRKVEVFPGCTYCQPQVASVGLTEKAAKEKGLKYKVGKFPFQASGKALSVGEPEGFVKLLFNEEHGEIIGAHIIGSEATEMIAELGLAITLEATYEDLEATIHAHPTLSEAVHEATSNAFGHAIHI